MKKWMYLIFPAILLAGFLVIYFSHKKEAQEKEVRHTAQVAKEKAEAEEKKRQEERDAEEKKKEEEKAAKQAADDKKVRDQTAEYTAKADAATKQVNALETELDRLRKEKDKTSREAFDLAKQVELTRIA